MQLITARHGVALHDDIENFIRDRYETVYGAHVGRLAPHLIANITNDGGVTCAAGLRTAADGFACEVYLDVPVEKLIASNARSIASSRDKILEVTSLCSSSPSLSVSFLRDIALFGFRHGFEWSVFVATARLRRLLTLLSFEPLTLATAARERMPNCESWGSYYDSNPVVMAVHRTTVAAIALKVAAGPEQCAALTCPLFASFAASQAAAADKRHVA